MVVPSVCDAFGVVVNEAMLCGFPVSGLVLADHFVHAKNQFPLTARSYMAPLFRMLIPFLKGPALTGDCHSLVLKRATA